GARSRASGYHGTADGSLNSAPSAGGGAAPPGGLGSMGGGVGGLSAGGASSADAAYAPAQATRSGLNQQAADHLSAAQSYRSTVVMRLVSAEKGNVQAMSSNMKRASSILGGLDSTLASESRAFSGDPEAQAALDKARSLIAGGGDSLKPRIDSSVSDLSDGIARAGGAIPSNCDFHPVVQQQVRTVWGGVQTVSKRIDITGVATSGQDLIEGAARRASNVRTQAQAGATMVDPTFGPAIADLQAQKDAQGAARLSADASRIKSDLGQVSGLLPDRVAQNVSVGAGGGQTSIPDSAQAGYVQIRSLTSKVDQNRLAYAAGPARDALVSDMSGATSNSRDALAQANALSGGPSDSIFALTSSARSSTYALDNLCDSYTQLKSLASQAQ
ncbi:MAG: hypothetical protein KGL53_04340, partial [Elusimicrobia bacterium]|nr:hypothetical protein [Elusimicrobiota bacterium]